MTAPFELERFAGAPASPDVAVLELEGIFAGGTGREHQRARLLVENAERKLEAPPVATAAFGGGAWRGTYALPIAQLQGATFALAVGRDLLLDLPAPDIDAPGGGAAHHVRLARETNELRARLDEAVAARQAAEETARTATAELDAERAARAEVEAARERAVAAGDHEKEARERAEAAVAEARSEREKALAGAGEEHSERLKTAIAEAERGREEALAAERARAAKIAHELRAARAEVESLRREAGVRRPPRRGNGNGTSESKPAVEESKTEVTRAVSRDEPTVAVRAEPTEPWSSEGTEGFRVLTPRASRPHHRAEDETQPAVLPPGAAATGARSFEPAHSERPATSTRWLAVAALAVALLAAILVVVLRVGLV
jgi:hypothetical protein